MHFATHNSTGTSNRGSRQAAANYRPAACAPPEETRSLAMRHGKLFDRNFALLQSMTNLIFIGAFQPQLNCFFDHRFRVFRCFSLADDAQLGTVCNIPTVLPKFDNSGESLGSFTSKKVRYSALCANSAKGGWQQRQVVEE